MYTECLSLKTNEGRERSVEGLHMKDTHFQGNSGVEQGEELKSLKG